MSNKPLYHVVSFSGGKDSTAMLLEMLHRGMKVDEVIFADTGMEYPELWKHLEQVEKYIEMKMTILRAEKSYPEYFTRYGHPSLKVRWCTKKMKVDPIKKYLNSYRDKYTIKQYIGFSYDELSRKTRHWKNRPEYCYPLIDWKMTDEDCLQYCYDHGFTWDGLYNDISRMNCWCCPLQDKRSLRALYEKRPELWSELRKLDEISEYPFSRYSVAEWEEIFNNKCEPYTTLPTMYIKEPQDA